MTTTKDLQKQIAELTAKHNLQTSVESKLPGFGNIYTNDFNHRSKGTKYTFTVHLQETPLNEIADKIQEVLKAFPPTVNNCLMFAGKDDHPTGSPFMLSWGNNIRNCEVQMQYVSGDFWAHIKLPIEFYNDVKTSFTRKIYDTEHHYFGGVSMKEIQNMQIRAYKLKMFEECRYYGGDVINFIEEGEDKTAFEAVVLTGKLPETA